MSPGRQRTPAELVDDAVSLQRRLRRALDDLDAGDPDALRDVAAYVRTLAAFGKGDGLLRRLSSTYAIPLPEVRLYELVEVGPSTRLAVGPLVGDDDERDLTAHSFDAWLRMTVVVSDSGSRRRTDWAQFITDYGNTFGAHAGTTVPEVLERVAVFRGAGGHMGGYLLRAAAVVTERALGALLADIGVGDVPPIRSAHPDGIQVLGFAIGSAEPHWHGFGVKVDIPGKFEVIGMPLQNSYMSVVWEWDGGSAGGSMHFDFDARPPA